MKRFIWLWVLFAFFACEEPSDWDLDTAQSDNIVIEAILTDERKTHQIKITKPYTDLNGNPEGINDADVFVSANGQVATFINDGDGVYKSEFPFRVVDNIMYNLKIEHQGQTYEASSSLSEVAPIPTISFDTLRNNENGRVFKTFASTFNPNQQAMYEVFVDWTHLVQNDSARVKMVTYTFSDIDISQIRPPELERVTFPKDSRVKVRKYGLNEDYAEFLRAVAIETIWDGTLFYTSGSNLPTNISGGAHGFFSTCAVLEENIIVE